VGYKLVIGNKNYSSWSMRAWLLLRFLEAPFEEISVLLYREGSRAEVRGLGGETGLVPVLIDDSTAIWDTLAIFETLFETYPQVWPSNPTLRTRARSYSGEVHSSLNALRDAMPVNTRGRHRVARLDDTVQAEIARVCAIWSRAGEHPGGPWLFGAFCAADIMFAPVATRFQTYDVSVTPKASAYYERLLGHALVQEWLALGAAEPDVIGVLELPQAHASSPD
jgi:glutathione S-transferase